MPSHPSRESLFYPIIDDIEASIHVKVTDKHYSFINLRLQLYF